MDSRRFDRNADQLSQIFFHVNRIFTTTSNPATEIKLEMLAKLEELLELNDKLGEMAGKGLI